MKTFGIIGTAGRNTDYNQLSVGVYCWMWTTVDGWIDNKILTGEEFTEHCALVSGAAAWADHCAVKLFLNGSYSKLTLHFPAPFNIMRNEFDDTESGHTANYYHRRFSEKCGWNQNQSLFDIRQAIDKGAITTINDGFKVRNALVAKDADYMFACTYGDKARLKDGGTAHTMSLFHMSKGAENSFHVNLSDLTVYTPALI